MKTTRELQTQQENTTINQNLPCFYLPVAADGCSNWFILVKWFCVAGGWLKTIPLATQNHPVAGVLQPTRTEIHTKFWCVFSSARVGSWYCATYTILVRQICTKNFGLQVRWLCTMRRRAKRRTEYRSMVQGSLFVSRCKVCTYVHCNTCSLTTTIIFSYLGILF